MYPRAPRRGRDRGAEDRAGGLPRFTLLKQTVATINGGRFAEFLGPSPRKAGRLPERYGPAKDWKFATCESAVRDLDFRLCHALARHWLVRNGNST